MPILDGLAIWFFNPTMIGAKKLATFPFNKYIWFCFIIIVTRYVAVKTLEDI